MTKLDALNEILTNKLDSEKGASVLDAINNASKSYNGADNATSIAEALKNLSDVFEKGGGGGDTPFINFDFSHTPARKDILQTSTILSYATGTISYKDVDVSGFDVFPSPFGAFNCSVDYKGIKGTSTIKAFVYLYFGVLNETADLSDFDFSSAEHFVYCFYGMPNLKTLDISKIAGKFFQQRGAGSKPTNYIDISFPQNCPELTYLDLSGIDFCYSVPYRPFEGCVKLTTIKWANTENWFPTDYLINNDNLDLSSCPLDHATIVALINKFAVNTKEEIYAPTLILHETTKATLTDEDKALLTSKNWKLQE